MTNTEKAALYDQLLRDHGRKATQVRELETNITPGPDDQKRISELKSEMAILESRATKLAQEAF
jgi:hypothetical protein